MLMKQQLMAILVGILTFVAVILLLQQTYLVFSIVVLSILITIGGWIMELVKIKRNKN